MHRIVFEGVENDWHNALPLGNGKMGAMVFRKGTNLHLALNHYDCYYDNAVGFLDPARKEADYDELCKLTTHNRAQKDYERTHYLNTLNPLSGKERPHYQTVSYPMAGEVVIQFSEKVDTCSSALSLEIEEAKVVFQAGRGKECIRLEAFVPDGKDGVLICLRQDTAGLWERADLIMPSAKGLTNVFTPDKMTQDNGKDHYDKNGIKENDDNNVIFLGKAVLSAPKNCGRISCSGIELAGGEEIVLAAGVLQSVGKIAEQNAFLLKNRQALAEAHRRKWKDFWKSRVTLPDRFLETLWHESIYLLECSSGRGGKYSSQVCGLCGLWDIRRPNLWGSMWYWDVNIQTVFQGVFTANQLQLARDFCDAYLSYEEEIRDYTRRIYKREGWALDYPHPLYNCIQPWCAGFLWDYYAYSGDREFLEKKAYPVFREQTAFFEFLAKEDEAGFLHIDPDISPEQGPVTRDSVITLACIKRLLKAGIQSALVLGRPEAERKEMEDLLRRIPPYPETANQKRFKDSALVQEDIFFRHPSILMPVFPAGEITGERTDGRYEKAVETLKYAANHTEIGTFGFSWLASSAAALGKGDSALQLLYGKGLDHILHSNGLGYEESERFINYCHITKPANYLPPMCEAAGGIVSTVNSMLLSVGEQDAIRIFPALPEGKRGILSAGFQYQKDEISERYGWEASEKSAEKNVEKQEEEGGNSAWKEVGFRGLLAPGGFEISAVRRDGLTAWLQVFSKEGGIVRLYVPEELSDTGKEYLLERKLLPGEILCLGSAQEEENQRKKAAGKTDNDREETGEQECSCSQRGVLTRTSGETGRRIFLGENRHTAFYKAWDSFTCPYILGDTRQQQMTPYIFDFTVSREAKSYQDVYQRQYFKSQKCPLYAAGPIPVGVTEFQARIGYGFDCAEGLEIKSRKGPDDIRKDFIQGSIRREFLIELPKGRYNLLLISGDEEEASYTVTGLPGNGLKLKGLTLAAGRYQCRILPVFHDEDGVLRISLDTKAGKKWKLNGLLVNKEYAVL